MKRLALSLVLWILASTVALAQCPAFSQGKVLTAGQWQACFDAKQNVIGYTPVNKAGDTMLGRLVTTAPSTTAGFNLTPGSTPSTPANGDLWVTAAGIYAQVNGSTVGPLAGSITGAALTRTNDTNVTLTLGGSPTTALVNAASITVGWSGTLAASRGGTGVANSATITVGGALVTAAAVSLPAIVQGDIWYGSAAGVISALAKNTSATRYLSNTGSSNNPAWAQVDLSNGVTGTFSAGTLKQAGAGSGVATLAYANTSTNSTLTLPTSASDTISVLGLAQTYTAAKTFLNNTPASPLVTIRGSASDPITSEIPMLAIAPPAATVNRGFDIFATMSGTPNISSRAFALNDIFIFTDNVDVGATNAFGFLMAHHFGGSSAKGGRAAFQANLILDSATSASNANRNYTAVTGVTYAANDNGTNTGAGSAGAFFGAGFIALAPSGATNLTNLAGAEINVAAQTGSTVKYKVLMALASLDSDAVQGATYDVMLGLSNQTGAVGWNDAILVGPMNGQFPLVAGGTVLRVIAGTYTNGSDFSTSTITGCAYKSSGFCVDGSGNPAAAGIAIPAGGTAGAGYKLSTTSNFGVFFGSGVPTLSAAKGSIYLRSDGSTTNDRAYINTNGSTTWTALTTAS